MKSSLFFLPTKKQRSAFLLLSLFLISCFSACTTTQQPGTPPTFSYSEKEAPPISNQTILETLNQNATHLKSLKAIGELTIQNENAGEQKCRVLLLWKNSGLLLLKGYQPLIPNYFIFLIAGENFEYYIPRQDILFKGKIGTLDIVQGYEIALQPKALKNAFLPVKFDAGTIISIKHNERSSMIDEMKNTADGDVLQRKIQFNHLTRMPETITVFNPFRGIIQQEISLSNFTMSGGARYAQKIEIMNSINRTKASFRLTQFLFNPEISDEVFRIDVPEGVKAEEIRAN